jgi:hypothetical protein
MQKALSFNMFIFAIFILLIISFILALGSLKSINKKPGIKEIKKSLDKDRIIYHSRVSSSRE